MPIGRQRGFSYIGLLLFMLIAGIGLAAAGTVWHTEVQREKERQLLFVGEQYRQAIASYYDNSPGGAKQFPLTLQELLNDARFPALKRHLRQVYPDPMSGNAEWGLLREQGRIVGVYSQSLRTPLKKAGFSESQQGFDAAESYRDWHFVYQPGSGVTQETEQAAAAPASSQSPATHADTGNLPAMSAAAEPPPDRSRQNECLAQRADDTAACSAYCRDKGAGSACLKCNGAIVQRYNACMLGRSLPALY